MRGAVRAGDRGRCKGDGVEQRRHSHRCQGLCVAGSSAVRRRRRGHRGWGVGCQHRFGGYYAADSPNTLLLRSRGQVETNLPFPSLHGCWRAPHSHLDAGRSSGCPRRTRRCSIVGGCTAPSSGFWAGPWESPAGAGDCAVAGEAGRASPGGRDRASQAPTSRPRWACGRAGRAGPTSGPGWWRAREVAVAGGQRHRSPPPPRRRQESAAAGEGTHIAGSSRPAERRQGGGGGVQADARRGALGLHWCQPNGRDARRRPWRGGARVEREGATITTVRRPASDVVPRRDTTAGRGGGCLCVTGRRGAAPLARPGSAAGYFG